jgi:regulator of sigma E protease
MMAIFAGPMMNFVLAFLLFLVFMYMTGVTVDNPTYVELSQIAKGSPAEAAGLKEGDIVRTINGVEIGTDREMMIRMIQESPDKTMTWIIERDGERKEIRITPREEDNVGKVGVGVAYPHRLPTVAEAVRGAGLAMADSTEQILIGLKKLVTFQLKLDDFGGPIRMAEVTGEAVSQGMNVYVFWAGLLSLYLGIFNLLPFPALDGSRLVFLGIEGLRGRPVDPQREGMVHFIGFAMLMLLMIAVTYNDILRLFKN